MNKSRRYSHAALITALLMSAAVMSSTAHAATPTSPASPTRPTIAGGQGGPGDEGSAEDVARHAAMAKYQACITATGVKMPDFGGFGGGFRNGARPTGAPTGVPTGVPTARPSQPALTAAQQAALNKCASLRPQFGAGFGRGGGPDDQKTSPSLNPNAGTIIKKSAVPTTAAKPLSKKTSQPLTSAGKTSAAYISCLNKAGINVKSASDVSKLDKGSPKISSALKTCAGK
jgi:hypothetical protein